MPSKPIFISHRHADRLIADVFNKHFQLWSVPRDAIFQSSEHRSGPEIGGKLKQQLREALSQAQLVLLIYTDPDEDWQFCMWECGVAVDPSDTTEDTKIVVFQAGKEECRVFLDEVVFKLELEDIRKFVTQFHNTKGLLEPGQKFADKVADNILEERAQRLFDDLKTVTPLGVREERFRWDRFVLWISPETLKKLQDGQTGDREKIILEEAQVRDPFGSAMLHFGYTSASNLTLGKLAERWRSGVDAKAPRGWIAALCEEMLRATNATPAEPPSEVMLSRLVKTWWLYPIVNHARILPDGSFEFDIYLYRLPDGFPEKLQAAAAAAAAAE